MITDLFRAEFYLAWFTCVCSQKEVIFFCLREEPVVFLRLEGDFLPYTPRRKENLHENLHDLRRDVCSETLELTIRREVRRWEYRGYDQQNRTNWMTLTSFGKHKQVQSMNEHLKWIKIHFDMIYSNCPEKLLIYYNVM